MAEIIDELIAAGYGIHQLPCPERLAWGGPMQSLFYVLIHLGHALISLEPRYRYLRKFHSLRDRRYVLLSMQHVAPALFVLLTLEFMPRRRHL